MEKRKDNRGRVLRDREYQTDEGLYRFAYYEKDKRKYYESWRLVVGDKTPPGKKNKPALREMEDIIKKKEFQGLRIGVARQTLNDYFSYYLENQEYKGRKLKETTINNYKSMWAAHVKDELGYMSLEDIRKKDVKRMYIKANESISSSSVEFLHKLVNAVFNMAKDERIINDNPAHRAIHAIIPDSEKCDENGRVAECKMRVPLTMQEQNLILHHLKENDFDFYVQFLMMIDGRLRVSELAGLTWSRVDFKKGYITIDRQLKWISRKPKGSYCFTSTKSKRRVKFAMTKRMREALFVKYEAWVNNPPTVTLAVNGETDLIFFNKNGGFVSCASFNERIKNNLEQYNKTARIKIDDFTSHYLKHTGIERLREANIDVGVIAKMSSHSSSRVTEENYHNLSDDILSKVSGALDELYEN